MTSTSSAVASRSTAVRQAALSSSSSAAAPDATSGTSSGGCGQTAALTTGTSGLPEVAEEQVVVGGREARCQLELAGEGGGQTGGDAAGAGAGQQRRESQAQFVDEVGGGQSA